MPNLTPMLVQCLVGLCCQKVNPDAIDITIGDMVLDGAAEEHRDVDVTVTVIEAGSVTHALKAYEVKKEGRPLDVATVEQLCQKLLDMPSVTHRAIVSTSGYSASAKRKAASKGVDLYELRPWTKPIEVQFPNLGIQGHIEESFTVRQHLLFWQRYMCGIQGLNRMEGIQGADDELLFDATGAMHPTYKTLATYREELLLRSTETLFKTKRAQRMLEKLRDAEDQVRGALQIGKIWGCVHSFDVVQDDVYIGVESDRCQVIRFTINGCLQWVRSNNRPVYYVIDPVAGEGAFAGAVISMGQREGEMQVFLMSPDATDIQYQSVRLAEKHLNCIRNLKL